MERREITGEVSMEIDTPGDELIIDIDDDDWNLNDDYGNFQRKEKLNPPLGLQTAVAENFNKFLDKSYTKNDWNCGLDLNLDTWRRKRFSKDIYDEYKEKQQRKEMVQYAVNDCASVAELYFEKYPEAINDYLTPPETPTTTSAITTAGPIVPTPHFNEVFVPVEQETNEENSQSKQNADEILTKQEIMLHRPELLNTRNEDELIDFLRPTINKQQQRQRTAEQERERKKEQQNRRNEKYKEKKRNRPEFINRLTRPIYYKYNYQKIRAQLMDDEIYHTHQNKINEDKGEVTINFRSRELLEEGKKKIRINYFSRSQYYKRWG